MHDFDLPRTLLVGMNSMLGNALLRKHDKRITGISHNEVCRVDFNNYDVVINMAYDPRYLREAYDASFDFDRMVADLVKRSGGHFVMMSTRRVYGNASKFPIQETAPTNPLGPYGSNKLRTEEVVQKLLGDRCTILRLGNVFGFEPGRHTFFGIALGTLRKENRIVLDANPFTLKDFLPIEDYSAILDRILREKPSGVFNLGYGIATATGRAAMWVIEGYGKGELVVTSPAERDPFLLDINKLKASVGMPERFHTIRDRCVALGVRLRELCTKL